METCPDDAMLDPALDQKTCKPTRKYTLQNRVQQPRKMEAEDGLFLSDTQQPNLERPSCM